MKSSRYTFLSICALGLAACGGGGGGSGEPGPSKDEPSIDFQGSTQVGQLATDDLPYVMNALVGTSSFAGNIDLILDERSARLMDATSRAAVNESIACNSGRVKITGDVNPESGEGYLVFEYLNCTDFYGNVSTGKERFDIETFDPYAEEMVDFTVSFMSSRTTYQDGSFDELNGTMEISNAISCDYRGLSNYSITSSNPNRNVWVSNMRENGDCGNDEQEPTTNQSGRIYIGDMGYFDLTISGYRNDEVMVPADLGAPAENTMVEGEIVLESANSRLSLAATFYDDDYGQQKYAVAELKIEDLQQQSTVFDSKMPAWYLVYPQLMDVSDSDGDGMWDGYENFYGLDASIDDSMEDPDGDGFTNLDEFLAFTSPNNPTDYPIVDLSLEVEAYVASAVKLTGQVNGFIHSHMGSLDIEVTLSEGYGTWRYEPVEGLDCVLESQTLFRCTDVPYDAFTQFPNFDIAGLLDLGTLELQYDSEDWSIVMLEVNYSFDGAMGKQWSEQIEYNPYYW